MEKFLDFEDHFDLTRDPETLSEEEVLRLMYRVHMHSTEHPDGGVSWYEEHEKECEDYLLRLCKRTLRLLFSVRERMTAQAENTARWRSGFS